MSEGFENGTPQFYGEPQKDNDNKGMAIASMVLGIVSIVALCLNGFVSIVAAIVAIVLGIIHNKKNRKNGMATAGIVCGIVALVLFVLLVILVAIFGIAIGATALSGI